MAFIEFKNIGKKYAGAEKKSVDDFNLEINEKEFIAFVGPSGCGKSTTLRMIAGFEEITEGELYIDGKKVNEVAPRDRGIAMVFQNYALYPHMTVEKNIGYGLKNMKMPADQIKKKVDWAIDILGLQEYRNRKPKNLSGGQRQRVALGRAIVKNQKVFLMDEPLSNLDAKLRVSMRTEISKLHRELGATTIYVTHDQVEAMTMADRIVIMKDGVIQQVGKPMELYDHPVNKFVAGFIGSPQMNFFDVTVTGNNITFADGSTFALSESVVKKLAGKEGDMILGIRGEDLKMDAANLELYKESRQKAIITDTEVMGNENNMYFLKTAYNPDGNEIYEERVICQFELESKQLKEIKSTQGLLVSNGVIVDDILYFTVYNETNDNYDLYSLNINNIDKVDLINKGLVTGEVYNNNGKLWVSDKNNLYDYEDNSIQFPKKILNYFYLDKLFQIDINNEGDLELTITNITTKNTENTFDKIVDVRAENNKIYIYTLDEMTELN